MFSSAIRQPSKCHIPDSNRVVIDVHPQVTDTRIIQAIEQTSLQQDLNRSLLRITSILQQCRSILQHWCVSTNKNPSLSALPAKSSQYTIELLLTQPELLESLRKAHMGNYGIILSLLGCLEQGVKAKKLVDRVIDSCRSLSHGKHANSRWSDSLFSQAIK